MTEFSYLKSGEDSLVSVGGKITNASGVDPSGSARTWSGATDIKFFVEGSTDLVAPSSQISNYRINGLNTICEAHVKSFTGNFVWQITFVIW